jgi:predicted transcriptional regulator
MDNYPRKLRLAGLLRSLQGTLSQTEFSRKIGIHQSALSGYLSPKEESRTPAKATDELIVKYLQKCCDLRWSLQELQSYLESSDSFEKFAAKLARRDVPEEKMTVRTYVSKLSYEEKLEAMTYIIDDLKKLVFPLPVDGDHD